MSEMIGHYVVGQSLGRGDYGEVYSAHYGPDPRVRVAIKSIPKDLRDRPGFVSALRRICEDWSQGEDPSIPRFRELICRSDQVVVVRELLAGADIGALLLGPPLRAAAVENMVLSLLSALAWLHRDGRVHGRLKPGNIFLCEDGRVVWLDHALAQATAEVRFDWESAPDLRWSAPESCRRGVDPRSLQAADVYSLGLVIWSLARGRCPCPVEDPQGQLYWHLQEGPERLEELPSWLMSFIARMTAALPENRPKNGMEALQEFKRIRDSGEVLPVDGRSQTLPEWARRPDLESMVNDPAGGLARIFFSAGLMCAASLLLLGLHACHRVVDSGGQWQIPVLKDLDLFEHKDLEADEDEDEDEDEDGR
jgi:serine/threonine protein kinase